VSDLTSFALRKQLIHEKTFKRKIYSRKKQGKRKVPTVSSCLAKFGTDGLRAKRVMIGNLHKKIENSDDECLKLTQMISNTHNLILTN